MNRTVRKKVEAVLGDNGGIIISQSFEDWRDEWEKVTMSVWIYFIH